MRFLAYLAVPALLPAALAAGCLVTETPQIQEPAPTAPFLIATTASPVPGALVVVDASNSEPVTFQAEVISQDDPLGSSGAFQTITPWVLFDYGVTPMQPGDPPYLLGFAGYEIPPGTIDETGRTVAVTWKPYEPETTLPFGCHTATLMVAHRWNNVLGCPLCADDTSSITWQVFVCDRSMPGNCDDIPVASCPLTTASPTSSSCENYVAEMDAGAECPATVDAGSP